MRRLAVLSRQLVEEPVSASGQASGGIGVPGFTAPKPEVLREFLQDPEWTGKPFWMLNVLQFSNDGEGAVHYAEYTRRMREEMLPKVGARIVLHGYARTVIGKLPFHAVAIVEYPSPKVFVDMAMSPDMLEKNKIRLQGLAQQYLIPMRPGWFRIDNPAPPPTRPITHFTVDNVWSTPNGMVGSSTEGAREGETSATREQVEAFVKDARIGDTNLVWHLNLLKFHEDGGEATYGKYAKAQGGKNGVLSSFGARSTLANQCYRSLMGDVDFDRAIIAEYPCRDCYFSMGADAEYLKAAHFRHKGLRDTYIISCLPEEVDKN